MTLYHLKSTSIEKHDNGFRGLWESGDKHSILFVWAPWCGYCKKAMPAYKEIAKEFSDRYNFTLLEEAELKAMPVKMDVAGYPMFYAVDKNDGLLVELKSFPRDAEAMRQFLTRAPK